MRPGNPNINPFSAVTKLMVDTKLTIPEVGMIAATRAMLGAGIALLLAGKMSVDQQRSMGKRLFLIGAITTVPLMLDVLRRTHHHRRA